MWRKFLLIGSMLALVPALLVVYHVNASENDPVSETTRQMDIGQLDELRDSLVDVKISTHGDGYWLTDVFVTQIRADEEESEIVNLTYHTVDGQELLLTQVPNPQQKLPPNREDAQKLITNGNDGYVFSTNDFSEIGWIESGMRYSVFSRKADTDELQAFAETLVNIQDLSDDEIHDANTHWQEAGKEKRHGLENAHQEVKEIGVFSFRPEKLHDGSLNVAIPDAQAEISTSLVPQEPHLADIEKIGVEKQLFGISFGEQKGETGTAVNSMFVYRPLDQQVWLTERPMPLGPNDTIPVYIPNEQNPDTQIDILEDADLNGYVTHYKHSGNHSVTWYENGSLLSLTPYDGELELDILLEIANAVE